MALRVFRMPEDVPMIHDWVTREYARYWGMGGASVAEVEKNYRDILEHAEVYIGLHDGAPAFLMESYDPASDPVGEHYAVEPGDRGMHILVAPPERRIAGFTWQVFMTVMDFLFADPDVRRIVVEPDTNNHKIHALNRRAGFRNARVIELPNKTAYLAFCTREDYAGAMKKENNQ